jgi:hypothetical protein
MFLRVAFRTVVHRRVNPIVGLLIAFAVSSENVSFAQITQPVTPRGGNQAASLNDILVNNLKATTPDQQAFLLRVVEETDNKHLEQGLALAVMRYAQRKHSAYPFPYFERAIRVEAAKRRVALPAISVVVTTKAPRRR